jgi:hypothetical protein
MIKVKEITRDGRIVLAPLPYRSLNITEQVTRKTIKIEVERENEVKERVNFTIIRRDALSGEVEAKLEFNDSTMISEES